MYLYFASIYIDIQLPEILKNERNELNVGTILFNFRYEILNLKKYRSKFKLEYSKQETE